MDVYMDAGEEKSEVKNAYSKRHVNTMENDVPYSFFLFIGPYFVLLLFFASLWHLKKKLLN